MMEAVPEASGAGEDTSPRRPSSGVEALQELVLPEVLGLSGHLLLSRHTVEVNSFLEGQNPFPSVAVRLLPVPDPGERPRGAVASLMFSAEHRDALHIVTVHERGNLLTEIRPLQGVSRAWVHQRVVEFIDSTIGEEG